VVISTRHIRLVINNDSRKLCLIFPIKLISIRPRRKLHISIEALFMIDFPMLKHKMSFFLDRKQQRVTLDISANGATESRNFEIPNINETSTIRSLALQFSKNRITLYVDCKASTHHDIDMNLAKLYTQMDDPVIKLVSGCNSVNSSGNEYECTISIDSSVSASIPCTSTGTWSTPCRGPTARRECIGVAIVACCATRSPSEVSYPRQSLAPYDPPNSACIGKNIIQIGWL